MQPLNIHQNVHIQIICIKDHIDVFCKDIFSLSLVDGVTAYLLYQILLCAM